MTDNTKRTEIREEDVIEKLEKYALLHKQMSEACADMANAMKTHQSPEKLFGIGLILSVRARELNEFINEVDTCSEEQS